MGQQEQSAEELAKQTQNPVADLISVPLQNNFNFGAGFNHNKMIYFLNIQPVIPIKLSEKWNLITRVIMPVINQPSLFPTFGGLVPSTTGTGPRRLQSNLLLLARQARRIDLGLGSHVYSAHCDRPRSGQRQMEHGTCWSRADYAGTLGTWRVD